MTREEQREDLVARAWPGQTSYEIDRQELDLYEKPYTTKDSI